MDHRDEQPRTYPSVQVLVFTFRSAGAGSVYAAACAGKELKGELIRGRQKETKGSF
jgi:hypothetical protein